MVTVVVFEFGGMRCQPLRRALCSYLSMDEKVIIRKV
ncbi:N-acetyltransferase, partial [Vibrio cholerae]|nr:N-acetyltransferase [Vibrio cholerae]